MTSSEPAPVNTTHDWASVVDLAHLDTIRSDPDHYAPTGLFHLVLEVMAYANDEAAALGRIGKCVVTVHVDGSISVADEGRGTATKVRGDGQVISKPVMATKDLRFFDVPHGVRLPDGHLRRGMSVVSALSRWLIHTNRRENGAWTQRYELGRPASDTVAIESSCETGTTVRFLVDSDLVAAATVTVEQVGDVRGFPWLSIRATAE